MAWRLPVLAHKKKLGILACCLVHLRPGAGSPLHPTSSADTSHTSNLACFDQKLLLTLLQLVKECATVVCAAVMLQ